MNKLASYPGTASVYDIRYPQEYVDMSVSGDEIKDGVYFHFVSAKPRINYHQLTHATSPQDEAVELEVSQVMKDVEEFFGRSDRVEEIEASDNYTIPIQPKRSIEVVIHVESRKKGRIRSPFELEEILELDLTDTE